MRSLPAAEPVPAAGLEPVSPPVHALRRALASPVLRVWGLITVMAVLAILLLVPVFFDEALMAIPVQLVPGFLVGLPPYTGVVLLALIFLGVESKVIHLHFGRSAQSFSMSEVPVVLGLFFLSPVGFLAARFLGSLTALVVVRRQSVLKVAFNLASFMLGSVVAIRVLRVAESGAIVRVEPAVMIGTLAAVAAENVVASLAVAAVLRVRGDSSGIQQLPGMIKAALLVALPTAAFVLLGVVVLRTEPLAAALFAIPIIVAYFAYQAYVSERQQQQGLEMLAESSRLLRRSPDTDAAVVALLEHLRRMFRADLAEITLLPAEPDGDNLRTTVVAGAEADIMRRIPAGTPDQLLVKAIEERRPILAANMA
ncbi:MAG: hypothetical protein U0869_25665, partial [Chloroflexota bacterium]